MTAEPHPQRCLHSHICKWNKDNYQDCIDTDCASHRYTYGNNQQSEQEKVLDIMEEWLNSDDHLSLYKWEVREKIRELRKGEQP